MNCSNHSSLVPFTIYRTIHHHRHHIPLSFPSSCAPRTSGLALRSLPGLSSALNPSALDFLPTPPLPWVPLGVKYVPRLPSSLWWLRASVSYTLSPPSRSIIFTTGAHHEGLIQGFQEKSSANHTTPRIRKSSSAVPNLTDWPQWLTSLSAGPFYWCLSQSVWSSWGLQVGPQSVARWQLWPVSCQSIQLA